MNVKDLITSRYDATRPPGHKGPVSATSISRIVGGFSSRWRKWPPGHHNPTLLRLGGQREIHRALALFKPYHYFRCLFENLVAGELEREANVVPLKDIIGVGCESNLYKLDIIRIEEASGDASLTNIGR